MEREVSHAEIYRELGILQGKMDAILVNQARDNEEKRDIFQRINRLETRMAQVIVVALLASLVLPPVASFVTGHLRLDIEPVSAKQ